MGSKRNMRKKAISQGLSGQGKIFGVALDASDDGMSLQLKHAAMGARQQGIEGLYIDPYDALSNTLSRRIGFDSVGKFPVPSWLGALPVPSDRNRVTTEGLQGFIDGGGMLTMMADLNDFVAREILPAPPVMLGIDHAATGGVLSALAKYLGPQELTVVVLDRHFDALPLSTRMAAFAGHGQMPPLIPGNNGDALCCGNFWAHLIKGKIVDPKHLVFVGVADYPPDETSQEWVLFKESYLAYEKQGVRFLPLPFFNEANYRSRLTQFLHDAITTPYIYVSLDLDVSSYNAVHAARYMDGPGIDKEVMMEIARIIADGCHGGRYTLAGLDIMEFNMHLLGLTLPTGGQDRTMETVVEFVQILLGKTQNMKKNQKVT
jgi:arginase family enzyme